MKAFLSLACLASTAVLVTSCGSEPGPTTPVVDPVDYVISSSATSTDASVRVDDELRVSMNGIIIASSNSGGPLRFRARPGDTVMVQALDTCQGHYWLDPLWIHRQGLTPVQITAGVADCSLASTPCIAAVDCGAPDRLFFQVLYKLP